MVRQVEVLRSIVEETGRVATVVILEIHGVRPVCLRQDDAVFCCKVRGDAVHRFAGSNAGFVVSVTVDIRSPIRVIWLDGDLAENASVGPLKFHVAVSQDIAVGIISQSGAVDAGQFILPGRIAIAETGGLCRKARVVVDFGFGEDVPSLVIAVRFGKAIDGVYSLGQLPILVIAVRLLRRAISGAGNSVLRVVGIHHIEGRVVSQRDGFARDVVLRIITIRRCEGAGVVVFYRFRGNVVIVIVREAVVHRVRTCCECSRAVRDLARITRPKVALIDGRNDCVFAT